MPMTMPPLFLRSTWRRDAAIGNTAGRVPRDPDDFCDNEGHMFEDTAAEFTKVLAEDFIG